MARLSRLLCDEHLKIGIRTGLGILLVTAIGWTIIYPALGKHTKVQELVTRTVTAAGITVIVVQAPVVGRVGQVCFDRTVGTVLGGVCGFLAYCLVCILLHGGNMDMGRECLDDPKRMGLLMSVLSVAATVLSFWIFGRFFKLEVTPRLFMLTFLLVAFSGAHSIEDSKLVMLSRIVGIVAGVIVSIILAVIVFPRSATEECLIHTHKALAALERLCEGAWQHGLYCMSQADEEARSEAGSSTKGFNMISVGNKDPSFQAVVCSTSEANPCRLAVDTFCEDALTDVYRELDQVNVHAPLTRAEIFVGVFRHKLWFLPALPYLPLLGRWTLPLATLECVTLSIRWVARLLWTLHLAFSNGFPYAYARYLCQAYPRHLLPEMYTSCKDCIKDLLEAFPSSEPSRQDLDRFSHAVKGLIQISDYHRKSIVEVLRMARKQMHQEKGSSNWPGYHNINAPGNQQPEPPDTPPGAEERKALLVREAMDTTQTIRAGSQAVEHNIRLQHQQYFYDSRTEADTTSRGGTQPEVADKGKGASAAEASTASTGFESLATSTTTRYSSPTPELEEGTSQAESSGRVDPTGRSVSRDISSLRLQDSGMEELYKQHAPGNYSLEQSIDAEMADSTWFKPCPSATGKQVPKGKASPDAESLEGESLQELHTGNILFKVEDILKEEQLLFSDSPDGQVALMRWSALQFLAEELMEALTDLYTTLVELIKALPGQE